MPDYKCAACRIRLRSHGGDEPRELCPVCDGQLQTVDELSDLVGFRALGPDAGEETRPISHLTDRREERVEELRVAAQRWLDDGGSFDTEEAVAAAVELPPPTWAE